MSVLQSNCMGMEDQALLQIVLLLTQCLLLGHLEPTKGVEFRFLQYNVDTLHGHR